MFLNNLNLDVYVANYTSKISSVLPTAQTSSTSQVLGYRIDKEGYFTRDFNKAANIPEDIKIHSNSLKNFVAELTHPFPFKSYESIDIAKTIGNAYKIFSQILNSNEFLSGKDNFNEDDLKHIPSHFILNSQGKLTKTFSYEEALQRVEEKVGFKDDLSATDMIYPTFYEALDDEILPIDKSLLSTNNWLWHKDEGIDFDKYINDDGSVSKAGLLMSFLARNYAYNDLVVGETTIYGKIRGLDKNVNPDELQKLSNKILGLEGFPFDAEIMNKTSLKDFSNDLLKWRKENLDDIDEAFKYSKQITELLFKSVDEVLEKSKQNAKRWHKLDLKA